MKVLVCGGREFDHYTLLDRVLSYEAASASVIIHGAARGADTLAGEWADGHGIQQVRCPANWARFGRVAGPKRNLAMLLLEPDVVIAFPGGAGTAGMVKLATSAGVKVIRVSAD